MFSEISSYNSSIILLSLIVLGIIFYHRKSMFFGSTKFNISYILALSGIIGNLYDRIFFGYVRDFIGVKYFSIFNVADIYLTFAVLMFILAELEVSKKKKKPQKV